MPQADSELSFWRPQALCRSSSAQGKDMLQEPAKFEDTHWNMCGDLGS